MKELVKIPAPRYWCSESQATCAIKERIRGVIPKKEPYPERKRLYDSLYEKFLRLREERPHERISLIIFDVVNSSAPESFLKPSSALVLLNRHKKKIRSGKKLDVPTKYKFKNETNFVNNSRNDDSSSPDGEGEYCDGIGNIESIGTYRREENCVHTDSCELDAPRTERIHTADTDVHIECKGMAVRSIDFDSSIDSRRYALKHTNVRYIRSQFRIDWDCNYEQ